MRGREGGGQGPREVSGERDVRCVPGLQGGSRGGVFDLIHTIKAPKAHCRRRHHAEQITPEHCHHRPPPSPPPNVPKAAAVAACLACCPPSRHQKSLPPWMIDAYPNQPPQPLPLTLSQVVTVVAVLTISTIQAF